MIGIIEDDRLLNQALKLTLEKAGYETMTAHTKKEALSLLGKGEELLLVDIGLPDGDGISLYQELRGRQKTPVIFLTARDEERDMLAAFDIGARLRGKTIFHEGVVEADRGGIKAER